MQRMTSAIVNPFLSPEFTIAVGRVRPTARVAVRFIRLAFTTDLSLAFLPARYFNVVHANSVFTHCPIEIIEECFAHVGRLMAPGAIFDFTFYRTNDAGYQVHHEDFYYRAETLIRLAAQHGLSARLMDDWLDPWDKQPKVRITLDA